MLKSNQNPYIQTKEAQFSLPQIRQSQYCVTQENEVTTPIFGKIRETQNDSISLRDNPKKPRTSTYRITQNKNELAGMTL